MTMLRVFMDDLNDPQTMVRVAERASAPIALTVLNIAMVQRAGVLIAGERERARYLAPYLSSWGDFSLFLPELPGSYWDLDVYALLKQAKADDIRAVWTVTACPGALLFRNRYCDRLTLGYVNAAPLEDLRGLVWAGVSDNIGTIPLPKPVGTHA